MSETFPDLSSLPGLGLGFGAKLPDPQKILELTPAVEFNGGKWEQIVLREPMIDEKRQAEEMLRNGNLPHAQTLYQIHLIAKVANVPVPVVQRIPVSKINEAMFYLSGFLFGGLPTGAS